MTWTKLLASRQAQKRKTFKKELDNMRALIARDLADAAIAGLSADRRFATAYNAALQAVNMPLLARAIGSSARSDITRCRLRACHSYQHKCAVKIRRLL